MDKITKRIGGLIKVKPEFEERYIILHKYTFPGVLESIRKSNIRNFTIFLLDGILFSHYEYIGTDYNSDMELIGDAVTKDWWKLTDPMQEPLETRMPGEWWASMELLLKSENIIKPSSYAQRFGFVSEILPLKEDEVKTLFLNYPEEMHQIANNEDFQNHTIYLKDSKLYLYFEYNGSDFRKSQHALWENETYSNFRNSLTNYLVPKGDSAWLNMLEVFHTD